MKDLFSGRIKESLFEKVGLALEGFRKQKRGRDLLGSDLLGGVCDRS